ncbi:efflux RND transporter periplasmic adaptor subunit [Alteromonas flava]|uniref:efflux RND transporter periplasmic adaptor subunit n=1 Tax=Alteromonas flava TaxID=2048003 RepID=UPI000C288C90|nr:efflux RND transporter periplasmic adaptor subunit [Alteromonas flava]
MNYRQIVIFSGTLLLLLGCSKPPQHDPIIRSVIAYHPINSSQQVSRTLSGVLQPVDQSELSFEIPGVVASVNVNLGETFARGDVLAQIDDKVFVLAVQQQQGQLSEAKARLTEAELDFKRKQQLVSSGAVSQAEVDLAASRFQSLADQVRVAQTRLEIAQEDLADTQLVAPYAGSVAQRHVEPSQQISPNIPILTIQGSDALEVAVLVPESMINQVQKGDSVQVDVLLNQQRQSLSGTVFEKGKQAQRANAFPVTIALGEENLGQSLQPGMSAEVRFSLNDLAIPEGALQAPLSAIAAASSNSHYVLAIEQQSGKTWVRQVAIDVNSMRDDMAIFTPHEPVTQIVRVGLDFLHDGQQVHITDAYPQTINQ